jgi:hypothetical protein
MFSYAGGPESEVRDGDSNADDEFRDFGFLVGYALFQSRDFRITGSAGLAGTWGERVVGQGFERSGFLEFPVAEMSSFSEIGVPFELGTLLRGGFLGLSVGLTGYANWNPEGAYGGFTVDLLVGALR